MVDREVRDQPAAIYLPQVEALDEQRPAEIEASSPFTVTKSRFTRSASIRKSSDPDRNCSADSFP